MKRMFHAEAFPDAPTRRRLLVAVGELCVAQGAFTAAAKKFAQAADMQNVRSTVVFHSRPAYRRCAHSSARATRRRCARSRRRRGVRRYGRHSVRDQRVVAGVRHGCKLLANARLEE